ncbi:fumarylacetoacetate hydrolase family protein [Hyphobacterium marinum]|uniref:Fumarylacetoacetate hydrolase family protein n=1 Tax=Hyphobacterium marinum TaxID=3116574 RepID=A0ABU7LZL6_9PROT|nr:fumarylacetoacetate hydrolase family protein [Hyphobacterium sp. Y6023]MEE2566991.1 fumarylacetoacetate hydrolase family protein [Hyphobacterium sp. Y6023]
MTPVFTPPAPVLVPIKGSQSAFPVRRIFCVGRNYSDHVKEMGGDPAKAAPVFFMKPAEAVVASGTAIAFPPETSDLHHEVELVVAIGSDGAVFGSAVGVDLTRRDLQAAAKSAGSPWEAAKAFPRSAPVGVITPGPAPAAGTIELSVNDETRQRADLSDMTRGLDDLLVQLARFFEPLPGDLVFTGTPAGVGPLHPGDRVNARIAGLDPLTFSIAPQEA